MKRLFIFLFVLTLILTACQSQPVEITGQKVNVDGGSYANINAEELNAMLKEKDFMFINVHIPFEGDIADTDLSIPYNEITEAADLVQLPTDKDAKIVLYCRSGRMSAIASEELVKLGYTNIWNLEGGMVAWERAGYEIQDK